MGLQIVKESSGPTGSQVTVNRRLYLTADRDRLVEEGDPAGRFLYCTPGKRVARSELLGLGAEIVNPDEAEPDDAPETLEDHNVEDLKDMLRAHDLKVSGRKADLVARLEEAGIGPDGEPVEPPAGAKDDGDGAKEEGRGENKEDAGGTEDKGATGAEGNDGDDDNDE